MPDIDVIKKTVFFVTRIGDVGSLERVRSDDLMDLLLVPVVKEFDDELRVVRGDQMAPVGRITDNIVHHLLHSDIIIADVTGRNPNVFYEVGIAHAFHRPIILIIDDAKNIPFDTHAEAHLALPGEGNLLGRTIEQNKAALLAALHAARSATTPPGPVAAAEAQLIPITLSAAEATGIMRRQLNELAVRIAMIEQGMRTAYHGGFSTVIPYIEFSNMPLLIEETDFLRIIILELLQRSPQVKELRGLNISNEEIIIDYIGVENAPRQFRVQAYSKKLQETLDAVLLEFGLYDTQRSAVQERLRHAGLT
jgi:hypothetical protein